MLMDVVSSGVLTERELLRLAAQDFRFEVIDGEIVEMTPVGFLHVIIAGNVYRILYAFAVANKLGYGCGDSLIFILHRDPKTGVRKTRVPDGSFIRKGRIPKDFDLSQPFPGAPDLAIEVMSPDDTATDVLARIRDYFAHGSEQVWVLYPEQSELHQYVRGEATSHIFTSTDTITMESLLPGFTATVRDFFAMPALEDTTE